MKQEDRKAKGFYELKVEDQEGYKWAKYRWEFTRRNPEAIDLLRQAAEARGVPFCFILLGPHGNLLPESTRSDPFWSPDSSFDEIIANIRKKHPGWMGEALLGALVEPDCLKFSLEDDKLKIEIDFSFVWSIESLKKLVSNEINAYYVKAVRTKKVVPKKRPNMADFDTILRVGDMKAEGEKNRDIAKAINPRKFKENPESAIRLVAHYHKRYRQLLKDNFSNFVYP
jgi:hypothetical protein